MCLQSCETIISFLNSFITLKGILYPSAVTPHFPSIPLSPVDLCILDILSNWNRNLCGSWKQVSVSYTVLCFQCSCMLQCVSVVHDIV